MVVRTGDEVRVRGGDFKGTVGKVVRPDLRALMVYVEGVEVKKNNGKTVPVPLHPSRVCVCVCTVCVGFCKYVCMLCAGVLCVRRL